MIEPGAKAAVIAAGSKPVPIIGVIATEATVRSGAYERAIHRRRNHARLLLRPTPLLVPIIEEGRGPDDPLVRLALQQYLKALLRYRIDVLVLGCTHYPVYGPLIREMCGNKVRVIDSAEQCADDVARRLRDSGPMSEATVRASRSAIFSAVLSGSPRDDAEADPAEQQPTREHGTLRCFVTDDPARFKRWRRDFWALKSICPSGFRRTIYLATSYTKCRSACRRNPKRIPVVEELRMRTPKPILLLLLAPLAIGCQHSSPPAPGTTSANMADSRDDDATYVNSNLNDDDEAPPKNFAVRTLDETSSSMGSFFWGIGHKISTTYYWFKGDRPASAAREMEDADSADKRREGINRLMTYDFATGPIYTRRYRQIAQFDPEATVRATAVRAANRARDPKSPPIFVRALNDKSDLVRLEGCKGLVHQPDPSAISPLLSLLTDREESRDVRIAAADALKHYRTPPVARALIAALNERDFSIAWQARRSLRYLTGRDYGYNDGAWLAYFTGPEKPF